MKYSQPNKRNQKDSLVFDIAVVCAVAVAFWAYFFMFNTPSRTNWYQTSVHQAEVLFRIIMR